MCAEYGVGADGSFTHQIKRFIFSPELFSVFMCCRDVTWFVWCLGMLQLEMLKAQVCASFLVRDFSEYLHKMSSDVCVYPVVVISREGEG